jgi:SAM-dependent methyltransferase
LTPNEPAGPRRPADDAARACPVCGSPAHLKPFYRSKDWLVVRCMRCTFAWAVDLDEAPKSTAFTWGEDVVRESQQRESMYRDRLARVERYQPAPRIWLDVGCGGGGLLKCARDAGYEVEGIELSPSADVITREFGIPVHKLPLAEVVGQLRHRAFGVVSYFHVLEHVPDPVGELRLAKTLLGPQGVLVVEVPFFDSLPWKVLGSRHRHFYRGHRSYFNRQSLEAILMATGFGVLEAGSVPYQMTADWLLMRLGSPAQRVRRSLPPRILRRSVPINTGEYLLAIARAAPV